MKLSRGKPQVTTQPTPAKAVYVQTTDGSYWNGQQFVWPLPETGAGAFENAYDALAFVLKAQDSPKMKYEEEDLRVVLRDQERGEDQLVITADQSQLRPVLVERWEKQLGVQFEPDALLAAQARISAEELPAFFMTGAPEQDKIIDLESIRDKKISTDHLLDLADLALASNGMGDNSVNRDELRMQVRDMSDDEAREHIQELVDSELVRLYGEDGAPDFIKPLSSYENELQRYQASLQVRAEHKQWLSSFGDFQVTPKDIADRLSHKLAQYEAIFDKANDTPYNELLQQHKLFAAEKDQLLLYAQVNKILPDHFLSQVSEADAKFEQRLLNHHERNTKPLPLSPLQQLMAENSASPSPILDEAPADDLPTSQVDDKKPHTATVSTSARPERPAGFDKIEAQRSFAGRLIAHGEAPYNNDKQEKNSYFVTFEHNGKEHTLWGKDLPNALAEAQVAIGDHVQLDFVGSQPVQVRANVLDDNGKKVGEEWQTKNFNMWRGKAVDADYCANFTPKEKPLGKKNAPAAPLEAAQKRPDGGKFGNKKPAAPSPATDPNDPANQRTTMVPSPGKAGAGIGAALGNMLGGIHRAGSSFASKLSGADKRDLAQRQNVEQHEQLLSAMTHSAARASAAATALTAGELAPVMAEIKQQGLALDDVLNTDKHPDLKEQYSSVMNKHGGAVKAALGELEWYATQAAESAKERGINIQPEVDEAIDKVKEDAKDIALPDEQGKWSSISDMLDKVLEKVHELIRQIFARFSPNSAQS
ncbi:hypothetical protein [Aeromonas caviae]|uniref:hypothetical protein n=1 Tax=Aeromonas caviae TaxID=648 RepID=UPI00244B317B|nr:hypothetical protein [Aeromonas caviae]MDH1848056.1 hypothetical protein [Aeromonas caviae]